MTWQENMNAAVAQMLREHHGVDAVTVTSFDDRTEYSGYCETCYYEETVCDISYVDSDGAPLMYTYYGSFGDLVRNIT